MRDVVGHQIIAQPISFVHRTPELASLGIDGNADRVPNAGGVDAHARSVGIVFQDVGAVLLCGPIADVLVRPHRDEHLLAIRGELDIPRTVMTAGRQVEQMLRRSRAGHIAVVIRETHYRVHVGDVHPLRIYFRIERDAKGRIQSRGEDFHPSGLALFGDSAQHLDVAAVGFSQEKIAVGSGPDDARIVQPGRIQLHFEALRSSRPGIRRPPYNFGSGGGRLGGIGRRKVCDP